MAKANIDVYKDWLGITESNRPLSYYQVLKLPQFEDDRNKIRKQYRELNAHVRKYATGDYIEESQALLNELAKAMLCLTDASRKEEYDHSLGRTGAATTKRRQSLGEILVNNRIISPDQLKKSQGYSDAVGVDLQQAVLQHKFASPEIVMLAYAESIGLPFINLDDVGIEKEYAPQINPNTARQHSFVPVMVDQGQLILASPAPVSPDVEEELRMLFEMPVRSAICVPAQINAAIVQYYPKDAVQYIPKKGAAVKPATTKTAAPKPAAPVKQAVEAGESGEYDEASLLNRIKIPLIAFNLGCMLVGFPLYLFTKVPNLYVLGGALLTGAIAAGIAWIVMPKE